MWCVTGVLWSIIFLIFKSDQYSPLAIVVLNVDGCNAISMMPQMLLLSHNRSPHQTICNHHGDTGLGLISLSFHFQICVSQNYEHYGNFGSWFLDSSFSAIMSSWDCELRTLWEMSPRGHFKNAYELINLRALEFLTLYKNRGISMLTNFRNSTQNILPIHWYMCSLMGSEDLRGPRFMAHKHFVTPPPPPSNTYWEPPLPYWYLCWF